MSTAPPGWHPDPRGRHEQRYWDGSAWTDHVADGGLTTIDPVDDVPRFAEVGGPRPAAEPAARAAVPSTGGGSLWARPEAAAEPRVAPAPIPADDEEPEPGPAPAPPPRSRDVALGLSVVAPGAGHLYAGGARQSAGFALLSATIFAVVIAYVGFGAFLVGLGIYLTSAAYALLDLADLPRGAPSSAAVGWTFLGAGTALAFSLLLPWYRVRLGGAPFAFSASAFEALARIDAVLLAFAAVVAGCGIAALARDRVPDLLWQLAGAAGALAGLLVFFRMLVDPLPSAGLAVSVGRAPGILLAGAAAVAACAAGVVAARAGYGRAP